MTEDQVKELLRGYGVSTPDCQVISEEEEIPGLKIKFPVALKVCSAEILHKTEVGGVKLNIQNKPLLKAELRTFKNKFPGEKFLVETMAEKGLEIIVGLIHDKTFGLCLMLGLGGIFTELLEDVAFRAVPITRADGEMMIRELKAKKVFDGFRGMTVDKEAVVDLLLRISRLGVDLRDQIDQLDLNPVIVRVRGLSVVDAKLLRKKSAETEIRREEQDVPRARELQPLIYPRSIALIGASTNPNKFSYLLLKNIIEGGFSGSLYPVNSKAAEVLGLKAMKSISDIEEEVDLGIIAVSAPFVPDVVEECGRKGVKGLLIITTGFSEFGSEGKELEMKVGSIAQKYRMRIIGPNCQGMINAHHHLVAAFAIETLLPRMTKGSLGLISQSGSVSADFLQNVINEKIGISLWINEGNRLDADESDFIGFMDEDPHISVIAAYLEGVKDGVKLLHVLKKIKKPLVVLKSGRTNAGQRAVQSHTAALAGNDRVWDGILKQHHVFRADSTEELFDLAKALNYLKCPRGNKLLIIASSGGLIALASDLAENAGLELPDLDEDIKERLRQILPPQIRLKNPLDIGQISGVPYARPAAAGIMDKYDALLLVLGDPVENAAEVVAAFRKNIDKPMVVVFSGGGEVEKEERQKIYELKVPVYPSVTRAMKYFQICLAQKSERP